MDWVSVLEQVYAPCPDEGAWTSRMLPLVQQILPDGGVTGVTLVAHDAGCTSARMLASVATNELCARDAEAMLATVSPGTIRAGYYPASVVTSMSSILPRLSEVERARMRAYLARYGARDSIGLVLHPEPGIVCVLFTGFAEDHLPTPAERQQLTRFTMHCETSLRLLFRPTVLRAVVAPDGRILHRTPGAPGHDELRAHVQVLERTRTRQGREDPQALELWTALLEGRASVVERFDGGKRLYHVLDNPPSTQPLRALSRREIGVLSLATRGLSTKMVGYTLGISPATVSNALGNIARKIGLGTRLELVRIGAMLVRDPRAGFAETALTEAERDVLELLLQGLSNREIASLRGRSVRTIANQVATLLRKTGAPSRRALATNVTRET